MEAIIAAIGLALAIVQGGYQVAVSEWGAHIDKDALALAKAIAQKISSNNALKEQLTEAYNRNSTELATSLLRGMGFGPRAAALAKMKKETESEYAKKLKDINAENVALETQQRAAEQAAAAAGTSVVGNINATKTMNDIKQNINGGVINP